MIRITLLLIAVAAVATIGLRNNTSSSYHQDIAVPHNSHILSKQSAKSIEEFGAVANNPEVDNSQFITKALNSTNEIILPANKIYYIKHTVQVQNAADKSIYAQGSTVINQNSEEATFSFIRCKNIKITGGYFTRPQLPTEQDGHKQHTLSFNNCNNITVTGVHINRSPEMGINLDIVIGADINNNIIEHCLRDGVYAHYSANLKYIHNKLNEIKDDALSMHDYGIDKQRGALHAAGYQQAGHSIISGNIITNAVQGIASIGCTDLQVTKNEITNTANGGIVIFNNEKLFKGTDARANNITVSYNTIKNCGVTVTINTLKIPNVAQMSTGRAAIFIGDLGFNPYFRSSNLRLADITITNNTVLNSAVNGATLYNVDGLRFTGNKFIDCNTLGNTSGNPLGQTGNIVEFYNCTGVNVAQNTVTDNRHNPRNDRGFLFDNTTGTMQKGNDTGWKKEEIGMVSSNVKVE